MAALALLRASRRVRCFSLILRSLPASSSKYIVPAIVSTEQFSRNRGSFDPSSLSSIALWGGFAFASAVTTAHCAQLEVNPQPQDEASQQLDSQTIGGIGSSLGPAGQPDLTDDTLIPDGQEECPADTIQRQRELAESLPLSNLVVKTLRMLLRNRKYVNCSCLQFYYTVFSLLSKPFIYFEALNLHNRMHSNDTLVVYS